VNIEGKVAKEHEFVHIKPYIFHDETNASQTTLWDVPHQGNNKEGGFLLDLKVGHKCN
jgi:hypothetical protein